MILVKIVMKSYKNSITLNNSDKICIFIVTEAVYRICIESKTSEAIHTKGKYNAV